jgi:hypothetical protein
MQVHLPVLHGTYITSNIETACRNAVVNARSLTKTWALAASAEAIGLLKLTCIY